MTSKHRFDHCEHSRLGWVRVPPNLPPPPGEAEEYDLVWACIKCGEEMEQS